MNKTTEEAARERIMKGRAFITGFNDATGIGEDYATDQELKRPQPPLAKAAMTGSAIDLPNNFGDLEINNDFLQIINRRRSHRVFTRQPVTLLQLSYLLWCTQGVQSVRGRSYATLRTVPSGGARHPFECYMTIRDVDGLEEGLYHYLPMTHQIEFLGALDNMEEIVTDSLCGQSWAVKANVIFYYSCVFYRSEWRYGVWAHGPVLIDSGHITQNLYLAAESIGLGGCAIAAVEPQKANEIFGIDGEEESIFYAMPVGTIRNEDRDAEDAFYAFVREEGL